MEVEEAVPASNNDLQSPEADGNGAAAASAPSLEVWADEPLLSTAAVKEDTAVKSETQEAANGNGHVLEEAKAGAAEVAAGSAEAKVKGEVKVEERDRSRSRERGQEKNSKDRERGDSKDRADRKERRRSRSRSRDKKRSSRSRSRGSRRRSSRSRDRADRKFSRSDSRRRSRSRDRSRSDRDRDRERSTRDRDRSDRDRDRIGRSDRDRDRERYSDRDRDRDRGHSSRDDRGAGGGGYRGGGGGSRRGRSRDREGGHGSEEEDYGYKPRKRQDTVPLKPLPPGSGAGTSNDPYLHLRNQAPVSMDPAEMTRAWQEQQLRSRQMVLQQQAQSAAAAATKTQRELYVGNLMPGVVTDPILKQLFNAALIPFFPATARPGLEPVVNINMHSDGRYAFVELRTPEMASLALELNKTSPILGPPMSVGRPSGYVDPVKATAAAQAAAAALAAFQSGDTAALTAAAPMAGVNLNHLLSGGQAGGINVPGIPGLPVAPTTLPTLQPQAMPGPPSFTSGVQQAAVDGLSLVPTDCLCVSGMISAQDLANDEDYKEVIGDLREECEVHAPGGVQEIRVPRPPQPQLAAQYIGQGNFGRAFVSLADPAKAQLVKDAIHGRVFAGSPVSVSFISRDAFLRA